MKKFIFTLIILCLCKNVFAEMIFLKSGKKIEGDIVEMTEDHMKVRKGTQIIKIKLTTVNIEKTPFLQQFEKYKHVKEMEKNYPILTHLGIIEIRGIDQYIVIDSALAKGIYFATQKRFYEAKKEFNRILKKDPFNYEAATLLGYVNDYKNSRNSKSATVSLFRGIRFLSNMKYEKSLQELERAMKFNPHYFGVYQSLGVLYLHWGKARLVISVLKESLDKGDSSITTLQTLSLICLLSGYVENAVPYLEKILQKDPNYLDAKINIGVAYLFLNQIEKAKICFEDALKINPESAAAYANLAYTSWALKKIHQAKDFALKAKYLYKRQNNSIHEEKCDAFLAQLPLTPTPELLQKKGDLKNGVVREYYPDGKIFSETYYQEGIRQGALKIYYSNGKLKVEGYFKNDKLDGMAKSYYESGVLAAEEIYKNGFLDGTIKNYNQKGKLKFIKEYVKGKKSGKTIEFYDDGKTKGVYQYQDDLLNGYSQTFYENRNLRTEEFYKQGLINGLFKDYFPTGELRREWKYKNGKLEGGSKMYFQDGILKATYFYEADRLVSYQQEYDGSYGALNQTLTTGYMTKQSHKNMRVSLFIPKDWKTIILNPDDAKISMSFKDDLGGSIILKYENTDNLGKRFKEIYDKKQPTFEEGRFDLLDYRIHWFITRRVGLVEIVYVFKDSQGRVFSIICSSKDKDFPLYHFTFDQIVRSFMENG